MIIFVPLKSQKFLSCRNFTLFAAFIRILFNDHLQHNVHQSVPKLNYFHQKKIILKIAKRLLWPMRHRWLQRASRPDFRVRSLKMLFPLTNLTPGWNAEQLHKDIPINSI